MRIFLSKTLVAATLFIATACHKDETTETTPEEPPVSKPRTLTKENLIGSYVITKAEVKSGGKRSDITDLWFREYAGECAKDDVTELKPDKSFVVMDATITCDESTEDTGTWDVIDATHLKWDQDTAVIEAFDGAALCVVSPIYSSSSGPIIFTYTRQ